MTDKHDEQAKELLPCDCDGFMYVGSEAVESHTVICAAYYRPAVAAALREKDAEIERLKIIIEKLREALADPPPDVQEAVIKKLNDDAQIIALIVDKT